MAGELLLNDMRQLNEKYFSSFHHSFYVQGEPEKVAGVIASMSTNATDRGWSEGIHLLSLPEEFRKELRHSTDLKCIYAVRISFLKPAFRKLAEFFKSEPLRALVLGYYNMPSDISEVIPINFEIHDNITLDEVVDCLNRWGSKES